MPSTRIIKIDPKSPQPDRIAECAKVIQNGGLVIFPTETVYGIAANFSDKGAIEKLNKIKNRPKNKNFSLHIARKEVIEEFASDISVLTYKLIDKLWPGPLTIVLKGRESATVGFRMPDNRIALELIAQAHVPIVAPSANLSDNPAPKKFQDAIKDFDGLVDLAIDGGDCRIGLESTVVDLIGSSFKILREGAIKKDQLEKVASKKTVLFVCTGNTCRSVIAKYLLEKALKDKGREDVEVFSVGMSAFDGTPASSSALALLKEFNIDASPHRAKEASDSILKMADLILVMEHSHESEIIKRLPALKNRVYLLKDFARIKDSKIDIPDPVGSSEGFFRDVFFTIKGAVEKIVQII